MRGEHAWRKGDSVEPGLTIYPGPSATVCGRTDHLPRCLRLAHGGQIFPFVYLTRWAYGVSTGLTELTNGRRLYVSGTAPADFRLS